MNQLLANLKSVSIHSAYAVLVLVWIAAPLYRGYEVESAIAHTLDCAGCFQWPTALADSPVVLLAATVMLLATYAPYRWLSLLLRVTLVVITIGYLSDIYVFKAFNNRLYISDITRYADIDLAGQFIRDHVAQTRYGWQIFIIGLLVAFGFILVSPTRWARAFAVVFAIAALSMFTTKHVRPPMTFVHSWVINNVIDINRDSGESTRFSAQKLAVAQSASGKSPLTCSPGAHKKPNIILLIIESWSSWQSMYFSGLNNWTPRLDAIAREHVASRDFYANGFTTNEGLVAFLTGEQPLPAITAFNAQTPFQNYWDSDTTLPIQLGDIGYQSLFLTSGDLSFSQKSEWLDSLGFDYVEGHEHADYIGLPRFIFDSVADGVLYSRVLKILNGDGEVSRFADIWPGKLPLSEVQKTKEQQRSAEYANFPYRVDLLNYAMANDPEHFSHNANVALNNGGITATALNNDLSFQFPSLHLASEREYALDVTLTAPTPTVAQLFFNSGEDGNFSEAQSLTRSLIKGENRFSLSFTIERAPGAIRFDPATALGDYEIEELILSSRSLASTGTKSPLAPDTPYFIAIETVTTHQPYINPMTKKISALESFQYADKAAGNFYDALKDRGFFEDGMLIITSDHRTMTPLSRNEFELFGLSAKARIPFIVVAPELDIPSSLPGMFQQRDVVPSLIYLADEETCQSPYTGNFLSSPPLEAACIMHHRGDLRDHVDVFCGDSQGTIKLDGDETRVVSDESNNIGHMVEEINNQRIRAFLDQSTD